MEASYFIIAILGCADGSTQCTPVMTVPTHYATQAACEAATPAAVLANSNFDFPSLLAECRAGTARGSADGQSESQPIEETRRG
jgi:hypothetical protein